MAKDSEKTILKYVTISNGRISPYKNKNKINTEALKKAIDDIKDSVIDYVDEPAVR